MRSFVFVTAVVFSFSASLAFAKALPGSKWKVKTYKITGEESAWTGEEAEAYVGRAVAFGKDQVTLGKEKCKAKIKAVEDNRRWTAGEENPCNGEPLKGVVYTVSVEDCSTRFPGHVAMPDGGRQAIAFGEGISLCLEGAK